MPSFNPIDYILAGCVILLIVSLGYSGVVKMQLEASEGQFRAFRAEVSEKAASQKLKILEDTAKRDKTTEELRVANVKLQSDLDTRYSEYKRLLNTRPSGSAVRAISDTASTITQLSTGEDEARLTGAMAKLEDGILDIAKSRDEAINNNVLCSTWLKQQMSIVP